MQHKRNLLAFILLIAFTVLLLSACSGKPEGRLSELADSELTEYLSDSGIILPEGVDLDTVRGIIVELEEDPRHPAPVLGDTLVTDIYEDIRTLVIEY